MRKSLSVVFLTVAISFLNAQVLINEFDTNSSSSEYLELFNTTDADIDLAASGYSLVFYNGSNDTEYQTTALTGYLSANGFFVIAESGVTDIGGYEPDQNASWTSFQNGQDAVALVANGTQVDAIIYGSSEDTGLETLLGLPAGTLISNGSSGSSSRVTDGQGGASYANDDWHITASRTPGSTNVVAPPTYTLYTIVEIQTPGTTDDASQHLDEYVETSGVITAATSYSFYMQDGTADYSGIYVYNSPGTAVVGDNVTVTGTVGEYYGFTQISNVADVTINTTGNDVPTPIVLTTGSLSEGHEGMLVKISGECTAVSMDPGDDRWAFKVDDGSGDALVDDQLFSDAETAATLGSSYDVVGPVNYSYSNFTVNPRDAADVVNQTPQLPSVVTFDLDGLDDCGFVSVTGSFPDDQGYTWSGWGATNENNWTADWNGGLDAGTYDFTILCVDTDIANWWENIWDNSTQYQAPAECGNDNGQGGYNYQFTVDGSGDPITVSYCAGTCEATCVVLALDGIDLPNIFALHNNYPNPFNPVTNITYDIPEVTQVTLDIYNISGQKVSTLAQGQHEPGRYRIQWNATNNYGKPLSSGMYIYRIRAGNFVSVKKLILMK